MRGLEKKEILLLKYWASLQGQLKTQDNQVKLYDIVFGSNDLKPDSKYRYVRRLVESEEAKNYLRSIQPTETVSEELLTNIMLLRQDLDTTENSTSRTNILKELRATISAYHDSVKNIVKDDQLEQASMREIPHNKVLKFKGAGKGVSEISSQIHTMINEYGGDESFLVVVTPGNGFHMLKPLISSIEGLNETDRPTTEKLMRNGKFTLKFDLLDGVDIDESEDKDYDFGEVG